MFARIRPVLIIFLVMTVLTGLAYPMAVTGFSQLIFPGKANGSLIYRGGRPVGSDLIGQQFDDPKDFWGRPSATSPVPFNASASSGSNLGPSNPALVKSVSNRIARLKAADPENHASVPIDLVTASASGLDPDISPAAARYQAARVARARNLDERTVLDLIARFTEERQYGFLGEPRVNVLKLNLALDALQQLPADSSDDHFR